MDASELDMLADRIGDDFAMIGDGIHLDLLGMLDKLRHDHGVVLGHIGCELQEAE